MNILQRLVIFKYICHQCFLCVALVLDRICILHSASPIWVLSMEDWGQECPSTCRGIFLITWKGEIGGLGGRLYGELPFSKLWGFIPDGKSGAQCFLQIDRAVWSGLISDLLILSSHHTTITVVRMLYFSRYRTCLIIGSLEVIVVHALHDWSVTLYKIFHQEDLL